MLPYDIAAGEPARLDLRPAFAAMAAALENGMPAADESYFVREMATESKIHTETQVLFLTVLGILAAAGQPVSIVTGLPVAQHTPGGKEAFTGLLRGRHEVAINGGERRRFDIDQVGVVPEAGGAYWHAVLNDAGGLANTRAYSQAVAS